MSHRKVLIAVDFENQEVSTEVQARLSDEVLTTFALCHRDMVKRILRTSPPSNGKKRALIQLKVRGWGVSILRFYERLKKQREPQSGYVDKSIVDTALTFDICRAVFTEHFDVVVLVAGDLDYIPVVEGLDAVGVEVWVIGPDGATAEDLILATPHFCFVSQVRDYIQSHTESSSGRRKEGSHTMLSPATVEASNSNGRDDEVFWESLLSEYSGES